MAQTRVWGGGQLSGGASARTISPQSQVESAPSCECRAASPRGSCFSKTLAVRLALMLVAHPATNVRYWCQDETRLGLKTIQRRKITAKGVKPIGQVQWHREAMYLYGMVEPKTG